MNIIVVLTPLIGTIFGVMYYYNSREFTELLLAQPIRRTDIFLGQYLGVAISLSLSISLGVGLPFLFYGLTKKLPNDKLSKNIRRVCNYMTFKNVYYSKSNA